MKNLSACASTCVYWAQLIRPRIFSEHVLRSAKDLRDFQSLLRAPPPSARIKPIRRLVRCPSVFYKLGDYPWFCTIGGLEACGAHKLVGVDLHVGGPVPPGFISSNTQRPVLHPLFYSSPRVLPMATKLDIHLYVENICFPTPALLFNLPRLLIAAPTTYMGLQKSHLGSQPSRHSSDYWLHISLPPRPCGGLGMHRRCSRGRDGPGHSSCTAFTQTSNSATFLTRVFPSSRCDAFHLWFHGRTAYGVLSSFP